MAIRLFRSLFAFRVLIIALTVLLAANWSHTEAAAMTLTVQNASVAVGQTASVPVILSEAPNGLSGFRIEITLDNPAVAEIVGITLPNYGLTEASIVSSSQAMLQAVDLNNLVNSGDTNITLASLDIKATSIGTSLVGATVLIMDDNDGSDMLPTVQAGTMNVVTSHA